VESAAVAIESTRLGRPYRLTVDRYLRLIAAGVVGEDEPVILWKGQLVATMGKGRPHSKALTKLYRRMVALVPEGWYVEQEQPLILGDHSMPEPDLSVVRGTPDDYPDRPATAADAALVVEVADSSLAEDLGEVLAAYAAEGIPAYWVANLRARRFEVYTDPIAAGDGPASYRQSKIYAIDDAIPVVLDGREVGAIPVRDVLS